GRVQRSVERTAVAPPTGSGAGRKRGVEMLRPLVTVGTAAAIAGLAAGSMLTPFAGASSHREAPLISRDPTADNTDLYAFVSPDRPSTVTIVANYIPLEEPAGGPNFNAFDDTVLYEIHVDNNGDAKEDITYQFRFKSTLASKATFLYAVGPITALSDPDWIQRQSYTLTRVDKNGSKQLGGTLASPPVNVGPRTIPNYDALVSDAIQSVDGGITVFAGQRDDPFFVDLGSIFDLGALRPFQSLHLIHPPNNTNGIDAVGGFNTHSIVLQVPITQLTANGHAPSGPDDPNAV